MDLVSSWKRVVLERYAQFEGRAGRGEFWWFVLANMIVYVVLLVLVRVSPVFLILYVGYAFAVLVPSIAVAIRRLHDLGKSGWMLLIGLIPIVGGILLLVWYASPGQPAVNQYGAPES
jgi:uncharacterized membrane protein YhaH (DUF805 family)